MSATKLVQQLLEEPDARDLGGKSKAFSLLRDAVLAQLPEGSTAVSQKGTYTFHVQGYGKLKLQTRWVIASPAQNVKHYFCGDTIDATANAIVLARHQDEVKALSEKLRRQVTANRVGGE